MLKQRQTQKMLQKLSPQQIQLMKLLQVPTAALDQRVEQELEANPALEKDTFEEEQDPIEEALSGRTEEEKKEKEEEEYDPYEDFDMSDYLTNDEVGSYKLRTDNYVDPDEENKTIPIAVIHSFHEELEKQLGLVPMADDKRKLALQLIGSIDDDGYLRREIEAIVDDLAFSQNVQTDEAELEEVLEIVQNFEPAGVGARDLQECLLIQIRRRPNESNRYLDIAEDILENHFDEFAKKHYDKLIRSLGIREDDLRLSIDEILKLNPKPGGTLVNNNKPEHYIIPDFTITNNNGILELTLNARNAPDLRISDTYKDMLRDYSKTKKRTKQQKDAVMFIKQKIDSAKWFIDAIKQRQQTMLNTMNAIMNYQYDYFLTGDEVKLRPMILKDIAEITGLDISTISRVSNSKYVQTEFGTFKLKSFFSESLQTDSGEEVSTREVKKILSSLIEKENKRKPLSDQKLTESLVLQGYNIARRTVAKYREQLNIPVARLRKQL